MRYTAEMSRGILDFFVCTADFLSTAIVVEFASYVVFALMSEIAQKGLAQK
jgi:hypothetical protein